MGRFLGQGNSKYIQLLPFYPLVPLPSPLPNQPAGYMLKGIINAVIYSLSFKLSVKPGSQSQLLPLHFDFILRLRVSASLCAR